MVKTINLCEGHKGGLGLLRVITPSATYKGTPITKLAVKVTDKENCVQCKMNKV